MSLRATEKVGNQLVSKQDCKPLEHYLQMGGENNTYNENFELETEPILPFYDHMPVFRIMWSTNTLVQYQLTSNTPTKLPDI